MVKGIAFIILAVAACAPVGQTYRQPEIPLPDSWNSSLLTGLSATTPKIEGWWRKFNDPTLNKLIGLAEKQNRDLAIVAERVIEARAQRGIAVGSLVPAVSASGGKTRTRSSENLPFAPPNPIDVYSSGLEAGWEIDFVGGLRRRVEAATASLEATEEIRHDTMVLVYSEVASAYIEYRTLLKRIQLAKANAERQRQSVKITKDRQVAGLAPEIDITQAEANLATTQALIPQLQSQSVATRNRLAVLIGDYPGGMNRLLGTATRIPVPPTSAAIGLPADLIRARPDIRAAERQLAAQTARVGVAEAELYPKFSLSGSFAFQAPGSSDVFESSSRAYSFGPAFRWRLFEGGAIRKTIRVEESRTRQALDAYKSSLLDAVAEVETSMASIKYERIRKGHLDKAVTASQSTVELIKDNYTEGLVDFQNVLDAERSILTNEDAAAVSAGQLALNHVALYRALGGGTPMKTSAKGTTTRQ